MADADQLFAVGSWRIEVLTALIGVAVGSWAFAAWGPRNGAGVFAGAALSLLNFLWLKRGVVSLAVASTSPVKEETEEKHSGNLRFWLIGRYPFVLLAACGIVWGFRLSVVAFLCGLFSLAAAVLLVMLSHLARIAWQA
jgi:hypothetical protein